MARLYAPRFGLTDCPAPLTLRLPAVAMVWSLQLDQDPASAWIRDQVAEILLAAELDVRDTLRTVGGRG
jgi:hypothetical protein